MALQLSGLRAAFRAMRHRPRPARPVGLFFTHIRTPELDAAFARLRHEAAEHVDWRLFHSRASLADLLAGTADIPAHLRMPTRLDEAAAAGRVHGGRLDLLLVPAALAADSAHVWIMEFDVDYSGHWGRFFRHFANNRADLLATSLTSRKLSPTWRGWRDAVAPVAPAEQVKGFFPLFRISRPLLQHYVTAQQGGAWKGHYEHVLPTVARQGGFAIEDIGHDGPYTPAARRFRHYRGDPKTRRGPPATFVFRPARPAYFHTDPTAFEARDMLYHPVKVGIALWERKAEPVPSEQRRDFVNIELKPWNENGVSLLRALNAAHQKRYLGGPESEDQLLARHARYLRLDAPGITRMLRIVVNGADAGSIGYWERDWQGDRIYETGWEVLEDFQGQGVASAAAEKLIGQLRAEARHPLLYAFPAPANAASNALCRRLGFTLTGTEDFEYPPGTVSPHNVWRLALAATPPAPPAA